MRGLLHKRTYSSNNWRLSRIANQTLILWMSERVFDFEILKRRFMRICRLRQTNGSWIKSRRWRLRSKRELLQSSSDSYNSSSSSQDRSLSSNRLHSRLLILCVSRTYPWWVPLRMRLLTIILPTTVLALARVQETTVWNDVLRYSLTVATSLYYEPNWGA